MTGGLFAPLPLSPSSPLQRVPPNYSVDSFSEYSTQTVNRGFCSPTSAALGAIGPHSSRGKEEDEELFRDLFTRENEGEEDSGRRKPVTTAWSTEPAFMPQKPGMQRTQSPAGNPNPRQQPVFMKHGISQPDIATPLIPRLRLEELVNARPDDDDNNTCLARLSSLRSADLEQVTKEDEATMNGDQAEHRLLCDRKLGSSMGFAGNNQTFTKNKDLEDETLRILEKLDLKAVLHTPRPELISFYPIVATNPIAKGAKSPHKNAWGRATVNPEDDHTEECTQPKTNRNGPMKDKHIVSLKDPSKSTRGDRVSARLAYMESMYGTTPSIPRKTRRETIDRLANPISGHSSTLQALSSKQREKRKTALSNPGPMSPISAAIAVSCRRGTALKKGGPATLLNKLAGDSKTTARVVTRKVTERPDPLIHKRQFTSSTNPQTTSRGSAINGLNNRKINNSTCISSRSITTRKETLKKKLQSRASGSQRRGDRPIGGSTFLTQRDDEEGVEMTEDFIKRSRGASWNPLTFRSKTSLPHRTIPSMPLKTAGIMKSRARPPQVYVPGRAAKTSRSAFRARGTRGGQEAETLGHGPEHKSSRQRKVDNDGGGNSFEPGISPSLHSQQPKRPQVTQIVPVINQNDVGGRSRSRGPTTPSAAEANPRPAMVPRAPKNLPSATTALLMGFTPLFSYSSFESGGKKARNAHHSIINASSTKTARHPSNRV